MAVLGILPARKGSKRVPGKNTKLLNGKPLVEYALSACVKSFRIDKLVVSSDDDAVEEIVQQYRTARFIRRPEKLSLDESPAIEYVHHVLEALNNSTINVVVIIQPTTPFVTSADIDSTIDLLLSDPAADSAVSVMQIEQLYHPWKLKVMQNKRLLPFLVDEKGIKAAQELPAVFVRNGAVYATHLKVVQAGQIIGDNCLGYVMPFERSIDINYPIDFEFAEFLAKKHGS